jgi:RND family efflux transporter MFP subunit
VDAIFHYALTNTAWALVLGVVAAIGSRVWWRRPAIGHVLWLLVLLKLLLPSLLSLPTVPRPAKAPGPSEAASVRASVPDAAIAPVSASPIASRRSEPAQPAPHSAAEQSPRPWVRPWPWRTIVVSCWGLGAILWWSILAWKVTQFRSLMRFARPAEPDLIRRMDQIAARLGLRRVPQARLIAARVPPLVWVPLAGSPRLILPEELWSRFDGAQQNAILAHELAHLRRQDHWVRRLQAVTCGLYWWNPISWWAAREIEGAEEKCCDAWVLWALPAAAAPYAQALVTTIAFLSKLKNPLPVGVCGVGRAVPLKRRLEMILAEERSSPAARVAPRFLGASCIFALVLLPALASEPATPLIVSHSTSSAQEAPKNNSSTTPAPSAKTRPRRTDAPRQELTKDDGPSPISAPPKVQVGHPISREITDDLYYMGSIQAGREVVLRPRVSGMIVAVLCRTGQAVQAGAPLFELDSRSFKAELDRAQAECERATAHRNRRKTEFANTERLAAAKSISRQELSLFESELAEAQASLKAAEAAREVAKINLEFTRVTAPFGGTITGSVLSSGNVANADTTTLATLIAIDPVHVEFHVGQNTILLLNRQRREGKLPPQLKIQVGLRGEEGYPLVARLEFTDIRLAANGTARWRAEVANPDRVLLPGMGVTVRLTIGPPYKALLIPRSAWVTDTVRTFVIVLTRDHAFEDREIKTGMVQDDGLVPVTEGLKADDWVVLDREAWRQMPEPEKAVPEFVTIPPASKTGPRRP